MFKLEYEKYGRINTENNITDIKDIGQILINIVNDEQAENDAMAWASNASFGDHYTNQKYKFTLTCMYSETRLKPVNLDNVKTYMKKICKDTGIQVMEQKTDRSGNIYLMLCIGASYMMYNQEKDEYSLHIISINSSYLYPVLTTKNKKEFATRVFDLLSKVKLEHPLEDIRLIKSIANIISTRTGIKNEYVGEDNGSITIDFDLGISYLKNNGGNGLYFALNDKNGKNIFEVSDKDRDKFINTVSTKIIDFKHKEQAEMSRKIKSSNISQEQINNVKFIKKIADAISSNVHIQNRFEGETLYSKVWTFNFKYAKLEVREPSIGNNKEVCFILAGEDTRPITEIKLENDVQLFIIKVSECFSAEIAKRMKNTPKRTKGTMRNEFIVDRIKWLASNNKVEQFNIYDDNCWTIDIDRCPNGIIRFWVGYEDKRDGSCNGSLCIVYDESRCSADFPLKKQVRAKVLSTYKALVSAGLI